MLIMALKRVDFHYIITKVECRAYNYDLLRLYDREQRVNCEVTKCCQMWLTYLM